MSEPNSQGARGGPSLTQAVIAGLVVICIGLVGFIGKDFHSKQIQVMENQADFRAEVRSAQSVTNLRLRLIEEHLESNTLSGDK